MRAKKHLGQNFLKSKKALTTILRSGDVQPGDFVLEVGPGKGVLTEALLLAGAKVYAIEKDPQLVAHLQELFHTHILSGSLTIIEGDVLETDIEPLIGDTPYKIIANIPYYITGQIIRLFLSSEMQPASMTLLVQKEVAERIVARDNKESILSISVKAYGNPQLIEKVPARYFTPAPNVDSAILHIAEVSKNFFAELSESHFFAVVRAGFAHKRKQLGSNLKEVWGVDASHSACAECLIEATIRAERLSLDNWKCLAQKLKKPR